MTLGSASLNRSQTRPSGLGFALLAHSSSPTWHPCRAPLAEKCRHAFLRFGRRAHPRDARCGVRDHAIVDRAMRDRANQRLCLCLRVRAGLDERAEQFIDPIVESVLQHDVVHETDAVGLGSVESLRGEKVTPRHPRADRFDHVRTDRRRDKTELRFRQRERRILRRDGDVAARDEPHTSAVGCAVNAGNRRFRERVERVQHGRQCACVSEILGVAIARPSSSSS